MVIVSSSFDNVDEETSNVQKVKVPEKPKQEEGVQNSPTKAEEKK